MLRVKVVQQSRSRDYTSSPFHSLSYMERASAGSTLHVGSTVCFLSAGTHSHIQVNWILLRSISNCTTIRNIRMSFKWLCWREITIFSFTLALWSIQILHRGSFLPVCIQFNLHFWLLESRTATRSAWLLAGAHIMSWMYLCDIKSTLKLYISVLHLIKQPGH